MGIVSDRINQFSKSSAVNSGMTWGDVGAILVSGRPVRNAFLEPQMVCLPAKTKLYKFNTYAGLLPDSRGHVTGWWSPYDAYDVDPGWNIKRNMARTLGVSIREWGRVTSAITEGWNSAEYLVVITLKVHIWAAYGRFKHQPRGEVHSQDSKRITHATVGKAQFEPGKGETALPYRHIRPEGRGRTLNLPGGGRQFFVPNLKPEYYTGLRSQSLLHM